MPGELEAECRGLGMDAVAAPDGQGVLVFEGTRLQRRQHVIEVVQEQIGGLRQLHRQARVQHIGRCHALMQEAAVRSDGFRKPGQERDDVVARFAFDGVDTRDIFRSDGRDPGAAALADGPGGVMGNIAQARHGFGGQRLDLEPDAVAVFGCPDGGHPGAGVAGDHRYASKPG